MSWKITVNPIRCRGHGMCALLCSEGLELDAWGYGRAVQGEIAGKRALSRARRAVRACPNGAITLVADGSPEGGILQSG